MYPMAGAAICGVLALIYLLFATRVTTVSSRVTVAPVKLQQQQLVGMENSPVSENYLNTQAELMTATPTLALALGMPGVDRLRILEKVDDPLSYLKKNLNVEVGKKNDIITVSYDTSNAAEGMTLVNSVVNAFINYQSNQMKRSTMDVVSVLRKERDDLNKELDEKIKKLSEFRTQNDTLSLGNDSNNIDQERLRKLSDALTAADVEVLNAKSSYETAAASFKSDPEKLKRMQEAQSDTPGAMAVDETALKASLFDLQQRIRDMSRQYMPNHPLMQAARTRLEQTELAYMNLMQQKYSAAKQKRDDLQSAVDQFRTKAISQSGKAIEYSRLKADVDGLEALTHRLEDQIKTTDITRDVGAINITVVDDAHEDMDKPTRPRRSWTLLTALILGAGIGLIASFAAEYTDSSLKSANDIEKSLGLTVLGAVPSMPRQYAASTHARTVHLNPGSEAAESYRSLRSAIVLNAGPRKFKTFLITSPVDGDGKTTIACNLAIALAKSGVKVLLVDTNVRDPGIHAVFGLPNDRGLSTVLVNDGEPEGKAIQASGMNNLDILTAGPLLDDPADLLNSPLLTETMVHLSRMYEMVIVDAAAILPVADGRIVAASCDASVLVLNSKRSNDKVSSQACEGLLSVGAEILGVVVNDVSQDRLSEGFDVSYAHLGGYNNELSRAASSERADRTRNG